MKILVYGINYSPELTGIGKYTGEMVEWMVQQGHEVRVITAPPYYPEWQVGAKYSSWRYRRENGDATVWRCPLYVPKQPSTLKRLIHLGSFAFSSFFPLMAQRIMKWTPCSGWAWPVTVAPARWQNLPAPLSEAGCTTSITYRPSRAR